MFKFFIENKLISSNQSDFRQGDSCTNQLVSITHEIYKSFDKGNEIRGVFLEILKTSDKVWHDGIIFKLTQNGISGHLIKLFHNFFKWEKTTRSFQRFHSWSIIVFNLYKSTNAKLFADDTSLFSVIHHSQTSTNDLQKDLGLIQN